MKIKKSNDTAGFLTKSKRINSDNKRHRSIQKNALMGAKSLIDESCSMSPKSLTNLHFRTQTRLDSFLQKHHCKRLKRRRRNRKRVGSESDLQVVDKHGDVRVRCRRINRNDDDDDEEEVSASYDDRRGSSNGGQTTSTGERAYHSDSETVVRKDREPAYRSQNNLTAAQPIITSEQPIIEQTPLPIVLPQQPQQQSTVVPTPVIPTPMRQAPGPFFKRLSLREDPINNIIHPSLERSPSLQQLGGMNLYQQPQFNDTLITQLLPHEQHQQQTIPEPSPSRVSCCSSSTTDQTQHPLHYQSDLYLLNNFYSSDTEYHQFTKPQLLQSTQNPFQTPPYHHHHHHHQPQLHNHHHHHQQQQQQQQFQQSFLPASNNDLTNQQYYNPGIFNNNNNINTNSNNVFLNNSPNNPNNNSNITGNLSSEDYASYMDLMIHIPNLHLY